MSTSPVLAVIGGSGFYDMPGLEGAEEVRVDTPFGAPSDAIRVGTLEGARVAFLARHGRGHTILPSEIPQRANFWALKSIGVSRVFAVSAVGSLREEHAPGHFVAPDQLIDRTSGLRPSTFFGGGIVAHVGFGHPFCDDLRAAAVAAARASGSPVDDGGTMVVIEGPAFGTKAESFLYRSWGASIVGMTAVPEAKLAREAELCYAVLAAVTDYDSWHDSEEHVTAEMVFSTLRANVSASQQAVRGLVRALASNPDRTCGCGTTLDAALATAPEAIPAVTHERLGPILARRLGTADTTRQNGVGGR